MTTSTSVSGEMPARSFASAMARSRPPSASTSPLLLRLRAGPDAPLRQLLDPFDRHLSRRRDFLDEALVERADLLAQLLRARFR